jgi:hypothetical protein
MKLTSQVRNDEGVAGRGTRPAIGQAFLAKSLAPNQRLVRSAILIY